MTPLRVALNCALAPGTQAGGTQSVVSGLVRALGELEGDEEYLLLCHPENKAWLTAVAGANTRLIEAPRAGRAGWLARGGRWLFERGRACARTGHWPEVPVSEGFYESLSAQVIHWPWQEFVVTALPAIFNPHDLLHLHLPGFLPPRIIAEREALYPVACRIAETVVVASEWTRRDFVIRYGLAPERVQVIPWAPPTCAVELARRRSAFCTTEARAAGALRLLPRRHLGT